MTFGLGIIAGTNLESLVGEYEQNLIDHSAGAEYTVRQVADGLYAFILERYEKVFLAPAVLPLPAAPAATPAAEPGPAGEPPADPAADPGAPPLAVLANEPEGPENEAPPDPPPTVDTRPMLGVVVGGYSRDEFFPDEFEMLVPFNAPSEIWPDPQVL